MDQRGNAKGMVIACTAVHRQIEGLVVDGMNEPLCSFVPCMGMLMQMHLGGMVTGMCKCSCIYMCIQQPVVHNATKLLLRALQCATLQLIRKEAYPCHKQESEQLQRSGETIESYHKCHQRVH